MLDKPQIVQTTAQKAAVIRLTIPRADMQKEMGPAIGEVMAAVAAQGIGPAGPVFAHHFRMSPEKFDFEVGVPITGALTPTGRVKAGELPAKKVAQTIYHGPYEGLGGAWGEFDTWIATEKHTPAANLWESYVAGPESGTDATKWRTELNRPLKK